MGVINRILKNQSGMTLVEVMVAGGLLAGLSVAGMTMFKNQNKAQKTVEQNYETNNIQAAIRGILTNPNNCTATFTGQLPNGGTANGGSIKKLVNGVTNTVYPVNGNLSGTNIKITSYALSRTYANLASDETMLVITFNRGKAVLRDQVTKLIKLNITLPTPPLPQTITNCYSVSGSDDSLWRISDVDNNDIYYNSGEVGVGTIDPQSALDVVGIGRFSQGISMPPAAGALMTIAPGNPYGLGASWMVHTSVAGHSFVVDSDSSANPTTDSLEVFRNSAAVANSLFKVEDSGNVGIGNNAPQTILHLVRNNADALITLESRGAPAGNAALILSGPAASNDWMVRGDDTDGSKFKLNFFDGATWNTRLTLTSGGSLGLGTTSPTQKLQVLGNAYIANPGADSRLYLRNESTSIRGNGSDGITLETLGTDKLTVASNGNVGIGTATPYNIAPGWGGYDRVLDVSGGNHAKIISSGGGVRGGIYTHNNAFSGNGGTAFGTETPHAMYFITNGTAVGSLDTIGNLQVTGSISSNSFLYSSDKRLKKEIVTIDHPLEKVLSLRGVNFTWKDKEQKDIGFIAQEVEKVEPRLVQTDEKGLKSVKYGNIVAIIVEAIRELFTQQSEMKVEIENLRTENKLLRERLDTHELRMKKLEESEKK